MCRAPCGFRRVEGNEGIAEREIGEGIGGDKGTTDRPEDREGFGEVGEGN